jgi:hypothetical protein
MSGYFSDAQISEMEHECALLTSRYADLLFKVTAIPFKNEKAREYALHGFARRLGVMLRAIEIVFDKVPPDLATIPGRDDLNDATIAIHAFITNVFGCIDNLAWVWALEKSALDARGKPLGKRDIGIDPQQRLWTSLPTTLQQTLTGNKLWFGAMRDYRDSLSHRIPLYIPPHIVPHAAENKYRELELASNAHLRRVIPTSSDAYVTSRSNWPAFSR